MVTPIPLPLDPSGPLSRPTAHRTPHPSAHRPVTAARAGATDSVTWLHTHAEVERLQLDDRSWVDVVRGLVPEAERVHREVLQTTPWRQGRSFRYERWVDDTRLSATVSGARRHPALAAVEAWLVRRYGARFSGVVLTQYRDARESLGFHRDTGMTWLDDTLVAVFTLGAQRSWFLRPDTGRQRFADDDELRDVVDLAPAGGDLIVMGGACQRDWLHAVPPSAVAVGGRISAQWRWTSRRGEPDQSLRHRDAWRFTSTR